MRPLVLVITIVTIVTISGKCTQIEQIVSKAERQFPPKAQIRKTDDAQICTDTPNCCNYNAETILARTANTLFKKYIFGECLQDFKRALDAISEKYYHEVNVVLGNKLRSVVQHYVEDYETNNYEALLKTELRILLPGATLTDACLAAAKNTDLTLKKHVVPLLDSLSALRMGIRSATALIQALAQQVLSPQCVDSITRSSVLTVGCNQCNDETATYKSCRTLCSNVVNGCIKPLLPIKPIWEEWQSIMDHLDYNFSRNLKTIEALDFDKILHLNFNLDIEKNLATVCQYEYGKGKLSRITRVTETVSQRVSESSMNRRDGAYDLFDEMFDQLQYKFCHELDFSNVDDTNCWTGQGVGDYVTKVFKFDEEQQAFNPEVTDNSYLILTARNALANLTLFVHQHREEPLDGDNYEIEEDTPDNSGVPFTPAQTSQVTASDNSSPALFISPILLTLLLFHLQIQIFVI